MVQIEPVSIWVNGVVKEATQFNLRIINDDLATSATFYYELKSADVTDAEGNVIGGQVLSVGNESVSGQEYIDWGASSDVNAEAYVIVAGKLNVVIVP